MLVRGKPLIQSILINRNINKNANIWLFGFVTKLTVGKVQLTQIYLFIKYQSFVAMCYAASTTYEPSRNYQKQYQLFSNFINNYDVNAGSNSRRLCISCLFVGIAKTRKQLD